MKKLSLALLIVLLSPFTSAASEEALESIRNAVANNARPDIDIQRDTNRKPAQVLQFFGIEPGMQVLDIFAGGGYYTEILSYLVNDEGKVTLYNNGAWDSFVGESVQQRLADNRLPNVESLIAEADATNFRPESYDAAIFILGFHDLYFEETFWPAIDVEAFLSAVYAAIKPGGILGIVDHTTFPGASTDSANTLHRIDPAIILRDLPRAGFVLEAESDLLRNPEDPLNIPVDDDSIQGRTDRVVYLFRKPG